jgi:small nuclear ribonucleoprotein (snRNP)-like protein
MENKVVAHMKDGTIYKGMTHDFDPSNETFHMLPAEGGGVPVRIVADDMKALFYVRDYIGNRDFVARKQFADAHAAGRRAIVKFKDGEEVWGVLGDGADDDNPGFFFFPVDREDNNIRIYVIRTALEELRLVS